jgi:hypothetical protein
VTDVIWTDWRVGVWAVAEEVNLDRDGARWILRVESNMRKFVQTWFQNCCQMNKKNVARKCVWTYATHWEWTRVVEFDNCLWWRW